MITTISEYYRMHRDDVGNNLPIGGEDLATTALTAAGSATMNDRTHFIRVATDTAVHISIGSAATTSDAYIPASSTEFFAVNPGDVVYIAAAA